MVELEADLLLAPETVESGRIAFDLQVGHFQRHRLAGLPVIGLEQRGHAALGDDIGDLKPVVQQRAHTQLWPAAARLTAGSAGSAPGLVHFPHLDDLDGDVVAGLALFGQGDQPLARFARDDI